MRLLSEVETNIAYLGAPVVVGERDEDDGDGTVRGIADDGVVDGDDGDDCDDGDEEEEEEGFRGAREDLKNFGQNRIATAGSGQGRIAIGERKSDR